jgi:retron-type reverse transcriptase
MRFCKKQENQLIGNSLASKFCQTDSRAFWKEMQKLNSNKMPLPDCVGEETGEQNIVQMWQQHYEGIFNSVSNVSSKEEVTSRLSHIEYDANMSVTSHDIQKHVDSLGSGKSSGSDNLNSEHLKYADPGLHVLLSMCFGASLVHGFLPSQMLETIMVPLLKNKNGKLSDKNNYRPIALASVISKVFEKLLLCMCQDKLATTDWQFGFKPKHSTDMAIYTWKQLIDYYSKNSSPVIICFLDASKAFDRLNHWTLFKKLLDRKIPSFWVRILMCWYCTQTVAVQWGNVLSTSFHVSNGVRQGGILSPLLFSVYMDDLSKDLQKLKVGCHMGGCIVNHILYADDAALISPSVKGMQSLLNKCSKYAEDHDILFNTEKSVCMMVKSKKVVFHRSPVLYLSHGKLGFVSQYKYLGCMISADKSDVCDIKRQTRNICIRANMLVRKFSMCTEDIKIKLFNSFCQNLYCAHLWTFFDKKSLEKLRVTYNNALRMLLRQPKFCSASGLFVSANISSFREMMRKYVYGFRQRIAESSNCVIRAVSDSFSAYGSRLSGRWVDILYRGAT